MIIDKLRERIRDRITSKVSLLRNNKVHVTREEIRKSISQIVSVKKKLNSILGGGVLNVKKGFTKRDV